MFRKRRRQDDEDEAPQDVADDLSGDTGDADAADQEPVDAPPAERPDGPYDLSEVDDPAAGGRVDLGGMWLPGRAGAEVRIEADQTTHQVIAVTLVLGDGALQVQPFAAPKTEGIWDDVRSEIRAGITAQGGTCDETDGPLGTELRTQVPVRAADGSQAIQPARFVGVDGPRWFLRGVLTGRPAVEPAADADLLAMFRDVVVVRGPSPMAPRDPIPLHLPATPSEGEAGPVVPASSDDLKPFERGPEITEIR